MSLASVSSLLRLLYSKATVLFLKCKPDQLCPQPLKIARRIPTAFQIKPKFPSKAFTFLHNVAPHCLFNISLQNLAVPRCSTCGSSPRLCFLNTSEALSTFFPLPRGASLVLFSLIKLLVIFQNSPFNLSVFSARKV